jgi:hypothetical protein
MFLALVAVVGALTSPAWAVAPKSVDAEVATLRARAANQARAGKWELAVRTLSIARERVQGARRVALRGVAPVPVNPQRQRAMKDLQTWYVGQLKQVADGKAERQQVVREFTRRQGELLRKYPRKPSGPAASTAHTAKLDLLLAALNDTTAEYNAHRGKPRAAASQRQHALIGRLRALKAQGQFGPAGLVAEKLLKELPRDPEAVAEVGEFYQGRKQFGRAAQVWEGGIRTLESGQADFRGAGPRADRSEVRKRYQSQFYRQVAFCYAQLGRGADAKAAMSKASQTEATLVRGGTRR